MKRLPYLTASLFFLACASGLHAADPLVDVKVATDDDIFVVELGQSLGYFKDAGVNVVPVKVESFQKDDYLLQEPLIKGQINVVVHWFQHTVIGARHNLPIEAVMVINDAPGMSVLVANDVKDQIKSAKDFKGRRVAKGAGYGTKSTITNYLASREGLAPTDYTPVFVENAGRLEAVVKGVKAHQVDVMTFQDPITQALLDTNEVSVLYDLTTRESTTKVLGAAWEAQCVLMDPKWVDANPETTQKVVNAFVKTMRWVNSHTPAQIVNQIPADYFTGKDKSEESKLIAETYRTYAHDYALDPASVKLQTDVLCASSFDESEEGKWRAADLHQAKIDPTTLYNNTFVEKAMKAIPAGRKADLANAGVSIWTQNVTGFRKEHGSVGGYTKRWDLSDMPHYKPKVHLTGTIRIWGNNYIKDGYLKDYWEAAFKKFQPDVKLEFHLPTTGIGIPALSAGVSDVSMSRKAIIMDLLTFEQVYHHPVTEIKAVTGSYHVYGWSPPVIIVVNKDNPITQISVKQLDGAFGAARLGGYVGSVWHTEYPYSRGADENIRTWGQLGLTGEWANKPIHTGGQTLRGNQTSQFSDIVTRGSDQFAEGYQAFANYITADGKINSWSVQAQHAIKEDKLALFYVSPMTLSPDMKELAIQAYDGGPYVKRSLESVHDRSYPMCGQYYFYFNRTPGEPVDPKVDEWLHFILSQEGQDEVQHEGRYIPLTGPVVAEELAKLE